MAEHTIRRIFLTPPVAIARLGGSLTPLVAFEWARGDPHAIAETRIRPTWTLDVLPDGSASPRMPATIVVRDGALLRPVAPFLELWALTGDEPALAAVPVTPDLLASNGASERDLTFTVEAMNLKAARRTGRASVRFGTFPPVEVRGDNHGALQLLGSSPPGTPQPMIPAGRFIPLGQVQVLRPVAQPADQPWSSAVRVDVVRLRFTPARGRFYGPPGAAQVQPPAIPLAQAFLNAAAGWEGAPQSDRVVPADTVDETAPGSGISLGVVDDTCDARIVAELALAGGPVRCSANVTVGPPQYAPDRRPFLSLADEINDRQHDPGRDAALSDADRAAWVEDLFERAFETASAMDLDFWRAVIARPLRPDERRSEIPGDGVPQPTRAMGGQDRLRDPEIAIPAPSANIPLPLSERARERHRDLSDLAALESWVREHPDRLGEIIRAPFADTGFSMQMPPFMRNSNARALSLARWQYDLLMAWADAVTAPSTLGPPAGAGEEGLDAVDASGAVPDGGLAPLSPEAAERRRQVLAALDAEDGNK